MTRKINSELWLDLARGYFPAFVAPAFRELHPSRILSENLAVKLLVDAMNEIASGSTNRLMVNIPPRSLKSFICSVAFIAFLLGRNPNLQILLIAGNDELRKELLDKLRRLMCSSFYRAVFPHVVVDPRSGPREIKTRHGGYVRSAVMGHQMSGRGADLVVIDDPVSPTYARDKGARDGVNASFDAEIITRLNDRTAGKIIVLMQRVHPADLSGHLSKPIYGFKGLVVPAIALWDERWKLTTGKVVARNRGEAIDLQRETRDQLLQRLNEIGGFNFNSQYLQGLFRPWDESESRMRVLMQKPAPYTGLETPLPQMGFHRVWTINEIMHGVFDVPRTGPKLVPYLAPNLEHWEHQAVLQQQKLVAVVEDDAARRNVHLHE